MVAKGILSATSGKRISSQIKSDRNKAILKPVKNAVSKGAEAINKTKAKVGDFFKKSPVTAKEPRSATSPKESNFFNKVKEQATAGTRHAKTTYSPKFGKKRYARAATVGAALAAPVAGAVGYNAGKKKMEKKAKTEEKRSVGQDLVQGARKAALVAAPVAALMATKNKKTLTGGVMRKARAKVGEAIGKFRDKAIVKSKAVKARKQGIATPTKFEQHLGKSPLGQKMLSGLNKVKSGGRAVKNKIVGSAKFKETRNKAAGGAAIHGALGAIRGITHGAIKGVKDALGLHYERKAKFDKKKFAKIVGGATATGALLSATKPRKQKKEATVGSVLIEKTAFSGFNTRQKMRKMNRNEY